ncbi:MAG: 3-keto-5-aminohexanoate cleavage protein, partial [Clostridiales bacterium]|nr:3-keto-5-aminohexanoate cleavage protein [Clostridiales bacterium]
MSKTNKVIIQVCLCGAGTKKSQAPTVPYNAEELSQQIVECAKAGASIAHIHVREDKEVNGVMEIGYKSMSLQKFTEAVEMTREACKKAGVDILINLTTSGGEYEDHKRLQHLSALRPEMCSFDPNTINWANSYIFENSPRFLNLLSQEVVKYD